MEGLNQEEDGKGGERGIMETTDTQGHFEAYNRRLCIRKRSKMETPGNGADRAPTEHLSSTNEASQIGKRLQPVELLAKGAP